MIWRRILAEVAIVRWSAREGSRRAANRWWDAVGRLAGFCMASTWRPDRATYGKGMRHWRCGKLRRLHAGGDPWHRTGDYRWRDGGMPIYDRGPADVGEGVLPRWLRGRHYAIGTRRRDRLARRIAFERIRVSMAEGPAYFGPSPADHDLGPTLGELGVLPFTGDLTPGEVADLGGPER